MKKSFIFRLAILGTTSLLLSSCLKTRSEVKEEEEKKVMQTQLQSMRQESADSSSKFNDIDSDIRKLNGRIEVLEAKAGQQLVSDEQKNKDLSQRVSDLEQKNKILMDTVDKLQAQILGAQAEAKAAAVKEKEQSSAKEAMGNFPAGEEHFKKKEWKQAVVAYQKYRDLNSNGQYYSEATYKIGVCFEEMGMKTEAKSFYDEVIEKSPKSLFAQKSKYRLKKLK